MSALAARGYRPLPMSHHQHRAEAPPTVRFGVVTASDTRGEAEDGSGRFLRESIAAAGHALASYAVVRDEPDAIRAALAAAAGAGAEAVVVNGGTGIAGRDRTYEAVAGLIEKRLDGFGELFRSHSPRSAAPPCSPGQWPAPGAAG